MPVSSSSASSVPWRSLYRSLIRQCTYLPDPIARRYMFDYVRSSFRAHRPKRAPKCAPKSASKPARKPVPKAGPDKLQLELERAHQHRRARRLLSLLRRAGEGYLRPLERVLLLSYGRSGRRRRMLVEPLLREEPQPQPQPQPDQTTPTPTPTPSHGVRIRPDFSSESFKRPEIVLSILRTQHKAGGRRHDSRPRPIVRSPKPRIADSNAWGRAVPFCRKTNIRKRWYAKVLNSVYPFLPEQDLQKLSGLATGAEPWTPPVRRKRVGESQSLSKEDGDGDGGLSGPNNSALTAEFLVHGAPKGHTFERYVRGRPHKLTPRLMQKMWAKVYNLVPRMEWDEKKKTWHVEWGLEKQRRPIAYKADTQGAGWLFDGLDSKGQKKKTKKRTDVDVDGGGSSVQMGNSDGTETKES